MTRRAACSCGQLQLTIEGESSRISMCHCLECDRCAREVIGHETAAPPTNVTNSRRLMSASGPGQTHRTNTN